MFPPTTPRGIHKSCSGPYPGYDQQGTYSEPLPNGRVRPEAVKNAQRHLGSLNLFSLKPCTIKSPRVKIRCPTEISQNNMEYSRKGTLHEIINGQASYRPDTLAHRRVRPEANEIAENHKGKSMVEIFHNQNLRASPDNKLNQEKSQNLNLLYHSAENPASYRPAPRVKPEANLNAQGAKGKDMAAILGKIQEDDLKAQNSSVVVASPKPSGPFFSSDKSVNSGGNSNQMKQLLSTDNKFPPSLGPGPRVKSEGQHMCRLDQGVRMNKLIYDQRSLPTPSRPHSRNGVSLTAKKIAHHNRGTVGNILMNIGRKQIVETPGLKQESTNKMW